MLRTKRPQGDAVTDCMIVFALYSVICTFYVVFNSMVYCI